MPVSVRVHRPAGLLSPRFQTAFPIFLMQQHHQVLLNATKRSQAKRFQAADQQDQHLLKPFQTARSTINFKLKAVGSVIRLIPHLVPIVLWNLP